jgi:hypothetical protein
VDGALCTTIRRLRGASLHGARDIYCLPDHDDNHDPTDDHSPALDHYATHFGSAHDCATYDGSNAGILTETQATGAQVSA